MVLAGLLQLVMAACKTGSLAAFFPSSVIKGLLAAIGIILILKQIPHLFGYDSDWLGDLNFQQRDDLNTLTALRQIVFGVYLGPTIIGLLCTVLLLMWDHTPLRKLPLPAPLLVVLIGIGLAESFAHLGGTWTIDAQHLVQVPIIQSSAALWDSLHTPDWSTIGNSAVIIAAITIALVASLETLLNLEAIDKLDPQKRVSPPNRELVAQGVGNITCGLLGALPITSVIVRSSVAINTGGKTRRTRFVHGVLLLLVTLFLPHLINRIPLACLAAILLFTGLKLATPQLFRSMWQAGANQFWPFILTVLAIFLTDLLIGILIGLLVASYFILQANLRRPLRTETESSSSGEVTRVILSQQVSFLNRAAIQRTLKNLADGTSVVLDAKDTIYIDADIVDLLNEFEQDYAPAHHITVSRIGFTK